jgi:hypothetical protein
MIASSPADRVRGRFMIFGFWGAALAFAVIEGDALLDQSEIGHASILFMLGTACLGAAGCLALFAFIMAIGVVVSAAFSEEPLNPQSAVPTQDASAAAAQMGKVGTPPAALAPERSKSSRRRPQRSPARTVTGEVRKAPPRAL